MSKPQPTSLTFRTEAGDELKAIEDNLERIYDCPTFKGQGRFFLRWDHHEMKFVSNRKRLFPED
jgi:hypothetical protein